MNADNSSSDRGPVRWGVLGVAKIATTTAVPAFQQAANAVVAGIASRTADRARAAAAEHGIEHAFSSYEALIESPEVDAVYIPLPNHLHRPWTIAALEAGKDVLCEKPIGLNAAEAAEVDAVAERTGRRAMEGFMYRFHPQWSTVHDLVAKGSLGEPRLVASWFSYPPNDPANVRYQPAWGGGALLDVGCYCVNVSRWILGAEPTRVQAAVRLGDSGVDVETSALLDFGESHATLTCGMEQAPAQNVTVVGTDASLTIPMPFNPRPDLAYELVLEGGERYETFRVPAANQFTRQLEACSAAILGDQPFPYPLSDSRANMAVLDAILTAA